MPWAAELVHPGPGFTLDAKRSRNRMPVAPLGDWNRARRPATGADKNALAPCKHKSRRALRGYNLRTTTCTDKGKDQIILPVAGNLASLSPYGRAPVQDNRVSLPAPRDSVSHDAATGTEEAGFTADNAIRAFEPVKKKRAGACTLFRYSRPGLRIADRD